MKNRLMACAALALLTVAASAQPLPAYDLLLRGGHVIDPRNRINHVMDVAIKDGKILSKSAFRKNRPNLPAAK